MLNLQGRFIFIMFINTFIWMGVMIMQISFHITDSDTDLIHFSNLSVTQQSVPLDPTWSNWLR